MTIKKERLPFIGLAGIALISGLLAGLQRIGWSFPMSVSAHHGAIMTGGFLGTLIAIEKVIPLKERTLMIIPALSAASVISFFLGQPFFSWVLLVTASVGLVVVFTTYWLREKSLVYGLMVIGTVCWLSGNVIFMIQGFYPASVPWWMSFILWIIAAERLELMKFLPVSRTQKLLFVGLLLIFTFSSTLSFHGAGNWVAAVALVLCAGWLMRFDVVSLNLKKESLTRYTGVALLSGYCALLLSGVFIVTLIRQPLGYDATIHSFFIGFVFSMIFAHGPIILPGVLGISLKPYHKVFYLWLAMLHISWIVRVIADLTLDMPTRMYSGLLSGIAIVGYFVSLVVVSVRSYRAKAV